MIYKFIENLSRLMMEWAMRKQFNQRPIIDEVVENYSYHAMRTERARKALRS
jgi:hypothetical protein